MAITERKFKRPSMWRHPRLLWRRVLSSWPLLLWAAGIAAVLFLYQGTAKLTAVVGVVETLVEPVAPIETARLLTLAVQEGQNVKAGDVVASMDTLLFDAETAVDEAQLIEVEGTLQDYQQRILGFVRDFEVDKNKAQFELETLLLDQKRDQSMLAVMQAELQRLEELKKRSLVSEQDIASLRPDVAALEQTVAAYPGLVDIHQRRLNDATEDETTMRRLLSDDADVRIDVLATIRQMREATDDIIRKTREQRAIMRASYQLRAARDGIVSEIFHQPGDVVPAGEPIMRLVAPKTDRIVGFLPEVHLGDVHVGESVWIWRQSGKGGRFEAVVESIAPEIDPLPGRVSPIRGDPLRGRRLVLRCVGPHDLLPGETVRVETPSPTPQRWFDRILKHK